MDISKRLKQLENQLLIPDSDPAQDLAECDPLSLAFFVAEAHGKLGELADPNPTPKVRRILEYIRQNPEKFSVKIHK